MWIALALLAIGAVIGWRRAARRRGTTADKVQYALAHGIPAFLVGVVIVVILLRSGWG
ncbi:MAG TPA: hypothetical protein VFJ13_08980 [Paracoccaceae bacterium]|nr:hypothetical protein [Paracoccaceae bacterium]